MLVACRKRAISAPAAQLAVDDVLTRRAMSKTAPEIEHRRSWEQESRTASRLRILQPCSPAPDAGPTILRPTRGSETPTPEPDARVVELPQARRQALALARPRH